MPELTPTPTRARRLLAATAAALLVTFTSPALLASAEPSDGAGDVGSEQAGSEQSESEQAEAATDDEATDEAPTDDATEATSAPAEESPSAPAAEDAADAVVAVGLVKLTNGVEYDAAPGAVVAVGSPVEWAYEVTNAGTHDLRLDSLEDVWSAGGDGGTIEVDLTVDPEAPGATVPPDERGLVIEPGESTVLTATGTAVTGPYENTATLVATPVAADGTELAEASTTTASSWYLGGEAGLTVASTVSGAAVAHAPGPGFAVGTDVAVEHVVTNTGSVELTDVALEMVGGVDGASTPLGSGSWASLAPGASERATTPTTAQRGQLAAQVRVSASSPVGQALAGDEIWFYGGSPALTAQLHVNGLASTAAPGTLVGQGGPVDVTLTVTNSGDAYLAALAPQVTLTAADGSSSALTLTGDAGGLLAPGASRTLEATPTPGAGQGTLSAEVGAVAVTAHDERLTQQPAAATANAWLLAGGSGLRVVKTVNGEAAASEPGPALPAGQPVTWTYTVTNTGTLPLTGIAVNDVETTPGHTPGDPVLTGEAATLAPGDSITFETTGTTRAGLYRNTVTATAANPEGGEALSASDVAWYTGGTGALEVVKEVAGADGVFAGTIEAEVGDPVTWRVTLRNTGDTALRDLSVRDALLARGDRLEDLDPGESVELLWEGTADPAEVAAPVDEPLLALVNTVVASATPVAGEPVEAAATATVALLRLDEASAAASPEAEDEPSEPADSDGGGSSALWWVLGAVVVLGAGGVIWWRLRRGDAEPTE